MQNPLFLIDQTPKTLIKEEGCISYFCSIIGQAWGMCPYYPGACEARVILLPFICIAKFHWLFRYFDPSKHFQNCPHLRAPHPYPKIIFPIKIFSISSASRDSWSQRILSFIYTIKNLQDYIITLPFNFKGRY